MSGLRLLRRLGASSSGSTAVEFALLAPAFIAMLLGVLQVGIGMQNYNALRGLSADVARYAMVKQAAGNPQTNAQLETYTKSPEANAPYQLQSDNLTAKVVDAATQRIVGVKELTLTVTYQIPTLFSPMGLNGPHITYSRPIFLTQAS